MNFSTFFHNPRIRLALVAFALFSIPWGYRRLFHQITPGFHEYEAFFFYAHDMAMLLFILFFVGLFFSSATQRFIRSKPLLFASLGIFLLCTLLSGLLSGYPALSTYAVLRLILATIFGLIIAFILRAHLVSFRTLWGILLGFGVGEAILAIVQFILQRSLSLSWLGEPYLPSLVSSGGALPQGLATVQFFGGKFLRAYGTFPHPNVLAAFLLVALAAVFYFWLTNRFVPYSSPRKWLRDNNKAVLIDVSLGICFFLIALALLFTFSRAAWALAFLMGLLSVAYGIFIKETRYQAGKLILLGVAIPILLIHVLSPLVLPRAELSLDEPSVTYRLAYNELAVDLIKAHPWGIGIGNQVIYGVESGLYLAEDMPLLWQWQPVHNLYLLMASEIGIVGALAFIIFIALLLMKNVLRTLKRKMEISEFMTCVALGTLLFFGLVDHFLWTLEPGRLMLWLAIGMVMAIPSGTDGRKS